MKAEQNTTSDRIFYLIEEILNTSVRDFALKVGFKRPDSLYRIKHGVNQPSLKVLDRIFKHYPQYRSYILTGETSALGDKDLPTKNELAVIPKVAYEPSVGRPFYNIDWKLGFDDSFEEAEAVMFNIDFPPANMDDVHWFRGRGNSMIGEIDSGDYIALQEIKDFSWLLEGKPYAIITKNGFRTIKKIFNSSNKDYWTLVSTNPDKENYPNQEIPKSMVLRVFKVIYVIKDLYE
ncbi:S24 family peptidase [Riemerella anatipestifer]